MSRGGIFPSKTNRGPGRVRRRTDGSEGQRFPGCDQNRGNCLTMKQSKGHAGLVVCRVSLE